MASSLMPSGTRPSASQIALINRVRQLRADLVAAHPKSANALRYDARLNAETVHPAGPEEAAAARCGEWPPIGDQRAF